MSQPTYKHTVGNTRRFVVDYRDWMNRGTTMTAFTAVVSAGAVATVSGAAIQGDDTGVFFVAGGLLDEEFTVTLTLTTSYGEIKIDEVPFVVVSP